MLNNQRVVSFACSKHELYNMCKSLNYWNHRFSTQLPGEKNGQTKNIYIYTLFWKSHCHPLASCMISFPNKVWKSINSRHPHAEPGKCCTGSAGGVDLLWRTGEWTGHIMLSDHLLYLGNTLRRISWVSAQFPVVHKHPPGSVDVSQICPEYPWVHNLAEFPRFQVLESELGSII